MKAEVVALIYELRDAFKQLSPLLAADDWSRNEIEEINALVCEHRDAGNVAGLRACLGWMQMKCAELQARPEVVYAAEEARCAAVRPARGVLHKGGRKVLNP